MEERKIADYLNAVSDKEDVYSYDEETNKILCVTLCGKGKGETISTQQAFNILFTRVLDMLLKLHLIFSELRQDKPTTNGEG